MIQNMSWGLGSNDLPRQVDFYTKKMGFELVESAPEEGQGELEWVWVRRDAASIMIGRSKDPVPAEAHAASTAYLVVDNVDDLHRELVGRGAKPVGEPETKFYGMREFEVRDADGNRLFFAQEMNR